MTIDGDNIELNIFDTAGQEDYDKLRPIGYSNVDVVLVCFSVDSRDSFANVESVWYKEMNHFCKDAPLILVCNKTDLREESPDQEQVST